jgi:hypothetical protein
MRQVQRQALRADAKGGQAVRNVIGIVTLLALVACGEDAQTLQEIKAYQQCLESVPDLMARCLVLPSGAALTRCASEQLQSWSTRAVSACAAYYTPRVQEYERRHK